MARETTSREDERRRARTDPGVLEWLAGGGWHAVQGTAHRGVLHPDEYVDTARLVAMVEDELGFTLDALRSVYRQGPLSAAQRARRARMDARLLAVAESGGTMALLGRLLGFSDPVITKALARARAAEPRQARGVARRDAGPSRAWGGPRRSWDQAASRLVPNR